MRRLFAVALSGLCFMSHLAHAQTPTTSRDYSDLWWNANENGWGMNVVHQGAVLFITLYVYGTDGRPTWYVASNVAHIGTNANGDDTYRGDLATTTGTPFNVQPFNPGATSGTVVGSITFTGLATGAANVTYTVNGVSNGVTKSVTRLTFKVNTVSTVQYVGATSYVRSGCTNPSLNGPQTDSATYTLTVTDNTFTLREDNGPGAVCNWNGTYTPAGRYGAASGVTTCEDNIPANFTFTDLQISPQAFSARFSAQETAGQRCTAVGRIGGPRR